MYNYQQNNKLAIVAVSAFLLFGVVLLGYASYEYYNGCRSKDWPTIQIYSIERSTRTHSGRGRPIIECENLTYKYKVNGVEYIGNKWKFGIDGIPVDEAIEKNLAHYNPSDHRQSVILPGVIWKDQIFKIVFGLMGVGIFVMAIACGDVKFKRSPVEKEARKWPRRDEFSKVFIDLNKQSVNGISFGSSFENLRKFGRPKIIDDEQLGYDDRGISLELTKRQFSGICVDFKASKEKTSLFIGKKEIIKHAKVNNIIHQFGTPKEHEHDEDEEQVLTYKKDDLNFIFEFDRKERLYFCSVSLND